MQQAAQNNSDFDSETVQQQDIKDNSEKLTKSTQSNSALPDIAEKLNSTQESGKFKQAYFFRNLLLCVSIILAVGTTIFNLDLLPPVLLGCGVIGFNYFWTMLFVRKMLLEGKLQALDLLFSLTKFGISVIIIFVAMQYWDFSPGGLLIGLSNIALAAIIYSFIRVLRPQKSA